MSEVCVRLREASPKDKDPVRVYNMVNRVEIKDSAGGILCIYTEKHRNYYIPFSNILEYTIDKGVK